MPINHPSTVTQFKIRWPTWASDKFENCLETKELSISGSRWGESHLRACRVLLQTNKLPKDLSEVLQNVQVQNFPELFTALRSIKTRDLLTESRSELRKKGGVLGSFFIHLANLTEEINVPQKSNLVRSPRHAPRQLHPDFVTGEGLSSPYSSSPPQIPSSSSDTGEGLSSPYSSSPPQIPSSSTDTFEPESQNTIDEDAHMDRTKSEIITAQMLTEFVSVIVDFCKTDPQSRLVLTPAPSRYAVKNPSLNCECLDDGSLIWHDKSSSGSWEFSEISSKCLIEVKSSVTSWNTDKEGDPGVDTRLLGQQICEMLGAFLKGMPEQGTVAKRFQALEAPHIFLISGQQTLFILLHVEFSEAYLRFFAGLKTLDDLAFLTVFRSKSYDLEREGDRVEAAKLIIALCGFLDICHKKEKDQSEE